MRTVDDTQIATYLGTYIYSGKRSNIKHITKIHSLIMYWTYTT